MWLVSSFLDAVVLRSINLRPLNRHLFAKASEPAIISWWLVCQKLINKRILYAWDLSQRDKRTTYTYTQEMDLQKSTPLLKKLTPRKKWGTIPPATPSLLTWAEISTCLPWWSLSLVPLLHDCATALSNHPCIGSCLHTQPSSQPEGI